MHSVVHAQKLSALPVCVASKFLRALNHCRRSSTSETSATGTSNISAHMLTSASSVSSGAVSSTNLERSVARRAASSTG